MLDIDMVCSKCFYSHNTYTESPVRGRSQDGVQSESESVYLDYCLCYADPRPQLVSIHTIENDPPDILAEPTFHKCGRGRWFDPREKKWVKWIDRAEE